MELGGSGAQMEEYTNPDLHRAHSNIVLDELLEDQAEEPEADS